MIRIGIDLGGTKIEGIALSRQGDELYRERVPTPAGDYRVTLQAISDLVYEIELALGDRGSVGDLLAGAGVPGLVRALLLHQLEVPGDRLAIEVGERA